MDLLELVRRFAGNTDVFGMSSFVLFNRILEEQCDVFETNADQQQKVFPRLFRKVATDSLQNPSDSGADYDSHKRQGYQVQMMETFREEDEQTEKDKNLNLIIQVEVEPANGSGVHALIPAIKSAIEHEISHEQALADSLYSDQNVEETREKGIEVVASAMVTLGKKKVGLANFKFSEKGSVTASPASYASVRVRLNGQRYSAGLEFIDRYRYQAGIEVTMSEYDKRTGAKRLCVRCFPAVRIAAKLEAVAINIFRTTSVHKVLNPLDFHQASNEIMRDRAISGAEKPTKALRTSMAKIWRRLTLREEFLLFLNFDFLRGHQI